MTLATDTPGRGRLPWVAIAAVFALGLLFARDARAQACQDHCGTYSPAAQCWCDDACFSYGDCCSDVLATCYTPAVQGVAPSSGPTVGGTSITITGQHLLAHAVAPPAVTVGGNDCPVATYSASAVSCVTPAGVGAGKSVAVKAMNLTGTGDAAHAFFSYLKPSLTGVSPDHGPTVGGKLLTISGSNFGTSQGSVKVGGRDCHVESQKQSEIVCTLPAGDGAGQAVEVTVAGQPSPNTVAFAYDPPQVDTITFASAPTAGGTTLTLAGSNFGVSTPTASVAALDCPVARHDQQHVECTLPAGEGIALEVRVVVGGQQSNPSSFSYDAPRLDAVTPSTGAAAGGSVVTLTGANFGLDARVSFGGSTLVPLTQAHEKLTVKVPRGDGGQVQVFVLVGSRVSNERTFTYDRPSVKTISPAAGPTAGGVPLTLTGASFGFSPTVKVGGVLCPPSAPGTDDSIVCLAPPGEGKGLAVVVSAGGVSSIGGPTFDYADPTLATVEPAQGPPSGGTTLTLTGANFGLSPASVTVGLNPCPLVTQTHTAITCLLPAGGGTNLPVRVRVADGRSSNAQSFSYDRPVLDSVSPAIGPTAGGVLLTLSGRNFGLSGASASVGGQSCMPTVVADTTVVCTLQEGVGRALPVVVSVGGQPSTEPVTFDYKAPTLSAIQPDHAPAAGGVRVTVTGQNLGPVTAPVAVSIGPRDCGHVVHDPLHPHDAVTCDLPAGQDRNHVVHVTVAAQSVDGLSFAYDAPVLDLVTPDHGPTTGGTRVKLSGSNFGASGATVTIGGEACLVSAQSDDGIVCDTPAGTGTRDVVVTLGNQHSVPRPFRYDAPSLDSVTPDHGPTQGRTILSLAGRGFGTTAPTVTVGASECPVTSWGDTLILCTLPAGEGTRLDVVIKLATGPLTYSAFSYDPPTLSAFFAQPAPTAGGTDLSLSGTNFGLTPTISVGGTDCPVKLHYNSLAVCTLPAGQGKGLPLQLTAGGQESNKILFDYDAPHLDTITPAYGPIGGGTLLTLAGTSFGRTGATVMVGIAACVLQSQDHSAIVCVAPAGTGTATLTVAVDGRVSNGVPYQYEPILDAMSPDHAPTPGGVVLTLSGRSFGTIPGTVTVGGNACPVTFQDDTHVKCTLPAGGGKNQKVALKIGTLVATLDGFAYDPPSLTSFSAQGAVTQGGTDLSVTGTNFGTGAPTVTVGGADCQVKSHTHTIAVCTLPAGEGTALPISLVAADQPSTNTLLFSYDAPKLVNFFAQPAPTSGGTDLSVTGRNFGIKPTMAVGSVDCPLKAHTSSLAVCTLPAGQGENLPLTLTAGGQTSNPLVFSYDAPVLTSIDPPSASGEGGATITILGMNLGAQGADVLFGVAKLVPATQTHTKITFTLPAGSGTKVPVSVRLGNRVSNTLTFDYEKAPPRANPSELRFGEVRVGERETLVVTLLNPSTETMALTNFTLEGDDITDFDLIKPPTTIPPGGSADLSVGFTPKGRGSRSATLLVHTDAPPLAVGLFGVGVAPALVVKPAALGFGPANVGTSLSLLLSLANDGDASLVVSCFVLSGAQAAEFSLPAKPPLKIEAGGRADLEVAFAPAAVGQRTGRLTLVSDDPASPAIDVDLSGRGTSPMLEVAPAAIDFGEVRVGKTSMPVSVKLTNSGDGPLTIADVSLSGPGAAAFTTSAGDAPWSVDPGQTVSFDLSYAPSAAGTDEAVLSIASDDASRPRVEVPVRGRGVTLMLAATPAAVDFGSHLGGRPSAPRKIVLFNGGSTSLKLSAIVLEGGAALAFTVDTSGVPAVLEAGASAVVPVTFTPPGVGQFSARLHVTGSAALGSEEAAVDLAGAGVSTLLGVTPLAIDFGPARVKDVVRSATLAVTNLGGDAITLGEATLTGAGTSSFSFDPMAGPLAAGETRTIAVRYAPRRAGDDKAQLHIRATDPAVPEATVALAGRGVRHKVDVVIDPKKLAFGQVDVDATETLALTISNPNGEAILLNAVISDSPEFVVAPVKLGSIPGGGSRQIDVTFRPMAKGQRSANITLEVADPDPRDVVVAASGRGKEKKR